MLHRPGYPPRAVDIFMRKLKYGGNMTSFLWITSVIPTKTDFITKSQPNNKPKSVDNLGKLPL